MRKKLGILLALIILLTALMPIVSLAEEDAAAPQAFTLTILHTNDMHSRIAQEDGTSSAADTTVLGLAKIAAIKKELMDRGENVLLVDCGDALHGKPFANMFMGSSVVEAMNAAGYDMMTPGNHEFNYGYTHLLKLAGDMKFPLLSANVTKGGKTLFTPSVTKTIQGVKIGFFGLTTPETYHKTSPNNIKGIKFGDPVAAAKKTVAALKKQGCQYIIALAHLGDASQAAQSSDLVARKVSGIDLIIDGHSHTKLDNGKRVGGTLIAQTGEYCQNLGYVTVDFKDGKAVAANARLYSVDYFANKAEDAATKAVINGYVAKTKDMTKEVIGQTAEKLVGDRAVVRTGMSNLGAMATDIFRAATGADVALTNGGGIRANIDAGNVTVGSVLSVFPFNNRIIVVSVKGSDIKAALEHGLALYPEQNGGFPHVSGITCVVDKEKAAGSRVSDVKVNGRPLNLRGTYKLATNDFMSIGGDGYTMLNKKALGYYGGMEEIIINYIKANGVKIPEDWDKRIVFK